MFGRCVGGRPLPRSPPPSPQIKMLFCVTAESTVSHVCFQSAPSAGVPSELCRAQLWELDEEPYGVPGQDLGNAEKWSPDTTTLNVLFGVKTCCFGENVQTWRSPARLVSTAT